MPVIQVQPPRTQRQPGAPALRGSTLVSSGGLTAPVVTPATRPVPVLITVDAAFGANLSADPGTWVWTDITVDLRHADAMNIHRGRPDEYGQVAPTEVTFGLNNANGQYTPRNAMGSHYPYIRQNLPLRIRFNSGDGAFDRGIVYADTFTAGWDPSLRIATVTVSASGILRRLAQGRNPLRSIIYRKITTASPAPIGYWEMSEGFDVNSSSCSLPVGGPVLSGTVNTITGLSNVKWGQGTLAAWLPSGVSFKGGGSARTFISGMPAGWVNTTGWSMDVVINVGSDRGTNLLSEPVLYATGAGPYPTVDWDIELQPAGVNPSDRAYVIFFEVNSDGTSTATTLATVTGKSLWDGRPHHLRLTVAQSGADIVWKFFIDGALGSGGTKTGKTLQRPAWLYLVPQALNTWPEYTFGDLTFWGSNSPSVVPVPVDGNIGETVSQRLVRLCAEQNVPLVFAGTPGNTLMGPQPVDTFLNLIRECETADGGILFEGLSNGGLAYLGRASRGNAIAALTLDMTGRRQVAPGWTPVEDDQLRRNDWTVSRTNGATTRFIDSTGPQGTAAVGVYDDSVALNLADDSTLTDQAAWRVHLGTVEVMRYPQVTLNFRASPELITPWRTTEIGARFTQTNPPTQHQPGALDLIYEGSSEFCDGFTWTATLNSGPYDPWNVAVMDSTFRLDLAGVTLQSGQLASATGTVESWALTVDPTYPLLIQTANRPADFPFDLNCEGEQVTVTAVVGASSPQTATVTRGVNGVVKAHAAGVSVTLWKPAVLAL